MRNHDPTAHWVLGFMQPNKDPKVKLDLADQRALRPGEFDSYTDAATILGKIVSSRMILPLANALSDVSAARDSALAKGTQRSREDQAGLRRDIDGFLVELVAARPRLEKSVESLFGAEAATDLRRAYQSGWDSERHYRLAWEIRNLTLHGGDALEGISYEAVEDGDENKQELVFKVTETISNHAEDKSWRHLQKLWATIDEVPILVVFTWAYAWAEIMYSHAVLANAERIEQAASFLMRLFLEAQSPQTKPVLYTVNPTGPDHMPERSMDVQLVTIDPSLAIEARLSIERAKARVAEWQQLERLTEPLA